jgi:hypothetical protein
VKEISTVKIPTPAIKDPGTVRMGVTSPAFPPVRTSPASVADKAKVQMGQMTPAFPPARAR